MLKRRTSVFFILFANIILLAHDIVPHHHHEGEVCIFNTLCQVDSYTNRHFSSENEGEPSRKNDYECCLLNQVVVVPSNTIRLYCKCTDSDDEGVAFFPFNVNLSNIKFEVSITAFEGNIIPPFIFAHTQIINSLLGLRAPPIV